MLISIETHITCDFQGGVQTGNFIPELFAMVWKLSAVLIKPYLALTFIDYQSQCTVFAFSKAF